jgi:hypothetical protein
MRTSYVMMAVVVCGALVNLSCDESLSELTGPTPNLQPTFSSIQRDIFDARDSSGRPACTQCHTDVGRNASGGTNLRHELAYSSLVNVPSRKPGMMKVVPGDPENSYLIHKLEGRAGIVGAQMPLGGPYLSEGQIMVIKRWIELGAPNN